MQQLQEYACRAGVHGGNARCRNLASSCPTHDENSAPAPRPDVVIIKGNLNDRARSRFLGLGIKIEERSFARSYELGRQHAVQARDFRRSDAIRGDRDNPENPESIDSGSPVFGRGGAHSVSVQSLIEELVDTGYAPIRASILERHHKPPTRLQIVFSSREDDDPINGIGWDEVFAFFDTCFGQVDVWANPRDARGRVSHTVNCGRRDDSAHPQHSLRFAGGDWELEPFSSE